GSLAPNGVQLVNLPSSTLTPGLHKLSANVTMVNNDIDLNPNNSIKHATTFPPANWMVYNPSEAATWTRFPSAGGFGNSTTSARMNFYGSATGQIDELYLPNADLQWVTPGISLIFSVAYA